MRLFIAVPIPDETKRLLDEFKKNALTIFGSWRGVKWVPSEKIHLTLKFFGAVEEIRLNTLENALFKSFENQKNFSVQLNGVGVFPDLMRARVLWTGVEDPSGSLKNLAGAVEKNTISAGFPPSDKPFTAHLTVARFNGNPPPVLPGVLKKHGKDSFGEIVVDKLELTQSRLTPSGPLYTILKEYSLNAD